MLRILLGVSLALSHGQEPPQPPTAQPAGGPSQPVESSSPASQQYEVALESDIRLTFVEPMSPDTVERSLSVFPARYAPHYNPATFTPLTLTSVCGGVWQVTNLNEARISFIWITDDGAERGLGVAPATSGVIFSSLNDVRALRLCVNGQLQAEEPPVQGSCDQPHGDFAWTDGNKTLTYRPAAPVRENTDYTLTLSTGAATQGGVALAGPTFCSFRPSTTCFLV